MQENTVRKNPYSSIFWAVYNSKADFAANIYLFKVRNRNLEKVAIYGQS